MVIDSPWLYIVLEHSRSPSTQDDYSSYRWFRSAAYRHCVIGLLTSIVWTLIDRLDDVYITDIVYLLDVLVVIVYMSYCNCWDYILLHEDWGEWSDDWAGACRWGGGGGGGIFNWKKISSKKCSWGLKTQKLLNFFQKCSWGSETHANKIIFRGGGCLGRPTPPPGGRAGSENDTLLPMTMTCDRLKFWSGPAWRSKVIIRKPWRRKN